MHLPSQFHPEDGTKYLVCHDVRATGATLVDVITDDEQHATNMARAGGGYVVKVERTVDFTKPRII